VQDRCQTGPLATPSGKTISSSSPETSVNLLHSAKLLVALGTLLLAL
jgi:hypothetical protein